MINKDAAKNAVDNACNELKKFIDNSTFDDEYSLFAIKMNIYDCESDFEILAENNSKYPCVDEVRKTTEIDCENW